MRMVQQEPRVVFYKPQGIPMRELEREVLSVEGLEAVRLVDAEGMQQEEAAALMEVSRPTLSRILAEARKTIALSLANGRAIEIDGGDYLFAEQDSTCPKRAQRCRRRLAEEGE